MEEQTAIPEVTAPVKRKARKQWSRKPVVEPITAPSPIVVQVPKVEVIGGDMTPEEKAIYGRVMAESLDWQTITEESANDFSLSRDAFELPEPAKKLEGSKRFKFRWITRTPARLDEVKNKQVPFRWWPVNLVQPVGMVFKSFVDPNNGCISREDQMLVFKPWWMFEKERSYKDQMADASANASDISKRDGERKAAGRDADVEISAGRRKGMDNRQLRQEVKGSDIQFRGEEEVDVSEGRSFPVASESDLTVDA